MEGKSENEMEDNKWTLPEETGTVKMLIMQDKVLVPLPWVVPGVIRQVASRYSSFPTY